MSANKFVKSVRDFDDDGLVPYLHLYACTPSPVRPFLVILMVLLLPVFFGSMATAAAEFLAVHLERIVEAIGVSEDLAGMTLFAFGNDCTDLFATLGMSWAAGTMSNRTAHLVLLSFA